MMPERKSKSDAIVANVGPLVSIGMPVYNGEKYIRQALDSLLAQDYENFELIISDNASTDGTLAICMEYSMRDPRIRYYCNKTNLGAVINFNQVIAISAGKYFMFASDNDYRHSSYVSRCVEILERDPKIILCYSRTMLVDSYDNPLGLTPDQISTRNMSALKRYLAIVSNLNWCNMIYGVIRIEVLKTIRGFKPVLGSDHAVLAELALRGEFVQIPDPLLYRRKPAYNDEDAETRKKILINMANPRIIWKSKKSYSELYRELAIEHLIIVLHAPIKHLEKLELIFRTVNYFDVRWHAWWPLMARILRFFRQLGGHLTRSGP